MIMTPKIIHFNPDNMPKICETAKKAKTFKTLVVFLQYLNFTGNLLFSHLSRNLNSVFSMALSTKVQKNLDTWI